MSPPHPALTQLFFQQLHFVVGRTPSERRFDLTEAEQHGYVNQYGQSRKHIFDSVQLSLKRLQLDYVDVLQCSSNIFPFFLFNRFLRGGRRRVCLTYLTTPAFKFVSFRQAIGLITVPPLRKWWVISDSAPAPGLIHFVSVIAP